MPVRYIYCKWGPEMPPPRLNATGSLGRECLAPPKQFFLFYNCKLIEILFFYYRPFGLVWTMPLNWDTKYSIVANGVENIWN